VAPRADEEHARLSFDLHLRQVAGITDATWEPFPNGENMPPDFYLRLGDDTFAVEVMSLFTQYGQGGDSVSEESIWKATERLTDEVEIEAAQAGILHGGYVLTLDGPYDNFFHSKKQLRSLLLKFITDTQGVAATPGALEFVELPSGQRCAVNKYESASDWVAAAIFSDGGDWNWEVVTELRMLLDDAVSKKAWKLRGVPQPWVLLLLDRHHFARSQEYDRVRQALEPGWGTAGSPAQCFRSINIVQANGEVFPMRPLRTTAG
jgi:hypothetical protein